MQLTLIFATLVPLVTMAAALPFSENGTSLQALFFQLADLMSRLESCP